MNKENFYTVIKIIAILFLFTNIYGLISPQLMPIYQILTSAERFSIESLITGNSFLFLSTVLFILFLLEPKKIGIFMSSSIILNLIISKIITSDFEFFYAINIASITGISAFTVEYIKNKERRTLYNYGLFMGFVSILFGYLTVTTLSFLKYILPNAYDIKALFIDSFYHVPKTTNQIFYIFDNYIKPNGYIEQFFFYVYSSLSLAIFLLAFWEYTNKEKRYFVNTLSSLSVLFILGALGYILFPIMGPKYLDLSFQFGDKNVVNYLNETLTGSIYARNGMPSLHFGLSLILLLNSNGLSLIKRSFFMIYFLLTLLATIILKEHYFIDWIGAIPFVILTLLIADKKLTWNDKKHILIVNVINIIIFYAFLWFGIKINSNIWNCLDCNNFNISMTIELYTISILSIVNLFYSYIKLYKLGNSKIENNENVKVEEEVKNIFTNVKNILNTDKKKLSLLFVLSGFAGLMYQVVFGKMLGTIFGSTSIAICIILATYMIGLSIGSWIATKNESNVPPILRYALCEGLIALYCALTPLIFTIINKLYFYLASENMDSGLYLNTLKIILGIGGLLIPTILMGMTTPILLKEFDENNDGISIAKLYSLNTLGAAIGSLLSGYFIIQLVGIKNSIYITVLLNLLISAFAINMYKKNSSDAIVNKYVKDFFIDFKNLFKKSESKIDTNYQYYMSNIVLFVSGILTMTMETVYTHSLSVVIGNSTYVFSIMLFTFLLGLTIGGNLGKRIIENNETNFRILSVLELCLGVFITLSYFLLDLIPAYFASFANSPIINTFQSRELLRFGVCFIVMIIPTIFTGLIYTISMSLLSKSQKNSNNVIGRGLSINTIGNILGVFLGSFYFINILQIQGSFKTLTLIAFAMGLLLTIKNKKMSIIYVVSILTVFLMPYKMNMNEITSGNNVYFVNSSRGDVVEYRDNADGGLTSVNKTKIENETMLTLLTNGKFQGNDNAESIAQGGFAIAPILHLTKQEKALVIGYGTGMTTKAIHDADFKSIDIIDLSPDILDLADKYFNSVNGNVRDNKNIKTHITDGRNYLNLTNNKYDLISMEISSIWFAGASYLYNKEFYEIAKTKLTEEGVLQQWVQLHHMSPNDFNVILNTVRNQFKYVNFYYIGHQGIIVATNSEKNKNWKIENINILNKNKNLEKIKSYYGNDFKNISNSRILNSEEIDQMLFKTYGKNVDYFISTDDNLYLEYKTPKGNVLKIDTENMIINNLLKYRTK